MDILSELSKTYGEKLPRMKILIIPAGGYSQRLPSASLLGKIFTAFPLGNPMYDLFDAKLASLIEFPDKMDCGIFLSCADTVELYHCQDQSNWRFPSWGITAQGHPSPIHIGTTHGVFLMAEKECCSSGFEVVECLNFLHKKPEYVLRKEGACLHSSYADLHGVKGDMVLTDSGYFMDYTTAKKLIDFYKAEAPLDCEIDCHGDFLQPLGPQATSDYITNTSNVCTETSDLTKMRMKVFNLLKGTHLNVLLQSHSQFFHLGTTSEYLDHLCGRSELALELGFEHSTFNKCTGPVDEAKSSQKPRACVMHSVLPEQFDWSHPCIVEFCRMKGNVVIQDNCIISNCFIRPRRDGDPCTLIPANSFLHTACIKGHNRYVTFVFDVRDNMKQSCSQEKAGNLVWLGKTFQEIFRDDLGKACDAIFPDVKDDNCSLWKAKLFRPATTMEESFDLAMTVLGNVHAGKMVCNFKGCLSMADILKQKNVSAMLEYRRSLYNSIKD